MQRNQEGQHLHLVKKSFQKIKELIEEDVRFTVRDIARKVHVGIISLSTVYLILQKHLKSRRFPLDMATSVD